jgi:hypothetical protein
MIELKTRKIAESRVGILMRGPSMLSQKRVNEARVTWAAASALYPTTTNPMPSKWGNAGS